MVDPVLVEKIIVEVRSLFHILRAAAVEFHGLGQSSAGLRGIVESLANCGPQTVPQLARSRPVSRQHIQSLVNKLVRSGLVYLTENPAHKRSRLVVLSKEGERAQQKMRRLEAQLLAHLPVSSGNKEIQMTIAVLQDVRRALADPGWRDSIRGISGSA